MDDENSKDEVQVFLTEPEEISADEWLVIQQRANELLRSGVSPYAKASLMAYFEYLEGFQLQRTQH